MGIKTFIMQKDTTDKEVESAMAQFREILKTGKDVAFVVKKEALSTDVKVEYKNDYKMLREEIIKHIVKESGEDPIICTTGKASRELTVAGRIDLPAVARACGYPYAASVNNFNDLDKELSNAKTRNELCLIEVKCSIGARDNLGRPTTTALENKQNFMDYLNEL